MLTSNRLDRRRQCAYKQTMINSEQTQLEGYYYVRHGDAPAWPASSDPPAARVSFATLGRSVTLAFCASQAGPPQAGRHQRNTHYARGASRFSRRRHASSAAVTPTRRRRCLPRVVPCFVFAAGAKRELLIPIASRDCPAIRQHTCEVSRRRASPTFAPTAARFFTSVPLRKMRHNEISQYEAISSYK